MASLYEWASNIIVLIDDILDGLSERQHCVEKALP